MIGNNVKAIAAGGPVLVVFYEDLKVDPVPQLARILQFLEVSPSPDTIDSTLKVTHLHIIWMIVTHISVYLEASHSNSPTPSQCFHFTLL